MTGKECMAPSLAGRRVLIATPGCWALEGLCAGMQGQGAECRQLASEGDFLSLSTIQSAFDAALRELGGLDALVLAVGSSLNRQPRPLVSLSVGEWQSACLDPLRTTRHCLQAAWRTLGGRPARIVLVGPNLALTGAAGLTALSVLSEGQRGLMKSAARQWGGQGIQLNWLGVDSQVFASELGAGMLAQSPEMGTPVPALGYTPDLATGVLESLALLIGAHAFTGASIPVDGGFWMVP
ncbi:SDR family oxidoreductase [Pseudomonas nicosulfuronedens]|uniref:SDR family oxidoreductase n=1 Tax=Pseudomonas nicosulfuronedens TaxID=2571105 RepID=A0A5R9QNT5_9PSED|nr:MULTISPECIES: SDR family oxidoreductase [Pseudomonas]TLX71324.1 SDR family oxidoreductase [Pseudomonas nicosulfuronedens]